MLDHTGKFIKFIRAEYADQVPVLQLITLIRSVGGKYDTKFIGHNKSAHTTQEK